MVFNTNPVQTFIRTIVFIGSFIILFMFSSAITALIRAVLPFLAEASGYVFFILNVILSSILSKMFFVLPEWQRLVLLRLGKFAGVKGPGLFIIPPFIYSVANILDIRIMTQQVEATATLTQDNVPTRVTAAIEYEIEDAQKAVLDVSNYLQSVTWLATEALKNTIGSLDLKELLSNRDEIANQLKTQIDESAATYGINVRAVRITDIDTPPELIEELAVIARARRAAQAKKVQADAEIEVAQKIAEASTILAKTPGALKLREIQNLSEMSKEESSMIIIYPTDSSDGKAIAHAAVGRAVSKKE